MTNNKAKATELLRKGQFALLRGELWKVYKVMMTLNHMIQEPNCEHFCCVESDPEQIAESLKEVYIRLDSIEKQGREGLK